MVRYVNSRNIKLLTSTLYYAQANGQVEAINKILINLIKKNIKDKPRNWHETFTQVFWAYRILKVQHVLHYIDWYGHDVVLPVKIIPQSIRLQGQNDLLRQDYWDMMYDQPDGLGEERLTTLDNIIHLKEKV
jgi:hypothetical protein